MSTGPLFFFPEGHLNARETFSRECISPIDCLTDDWYSGGSAENAVDMAVKEISRETQELRGLGRLKPFVEGEPIGKYKFVRRLKYSTKEIKEYRIKRQEWKRKEMLALRAKNDRDIATLLARFR